MDENKVVADYITTENGTLIYNGDYVIIRVDAWGRDGLRVRMHHKDVEQTSDWALDIDQHKTGEISVSDNEAIIKNGKISMSVTDIFTQNGYLTFYKETATEKKIILQEYDYVVYAHNPGGHSMDYCGDGLFRSEIRFKANENEHLYGMGLNARDKLDLKGSFVDLYQAHVKQTVPFVVSSLGYGFLWNNPAIGRVQFGTNMTRWTADACKQIDFYITVGDSYADIMENYADATGHTPVFPYWASGFWQCRLRYASQDVILNIVKEFKERGLPLSVIVIDFFHWKNIGDWKLDPDCWPDPKTMVDECAKQGVRIMISPWILISPESENFQYMNEHDMFTKWYGDGPTPEQFNIPGIRQYDPMNPEAVEYMWSKWKENYFDLGIHTFWLDPCDDVDGPNTLVGYKLGTAKECHSFFVTSHQRNIYEHLVAAGENEVVTICRNAWAGSQRWGACPCPHDIMSSFDHMRQYLKAGLNMMMSGIMWWNCDIGGFVSPDTTSDYFHELMIRWYQYGVFMPVFRTHGCREFNEPWSLGGNTYEYIKESLFLRERLRPYVMEQMEIARQSGTPPMRPLFYDYSSDPKTYDVEDAFLFGSDIYVAPIMEYRARERTVYLPCGSDWTDARTGKTYSGGTTVVADAPISSIPVFIKNGKSEILKLFNEENI